MRRLGLMTVLLVACRVGSTSPESAGAEPSAEAADAPADEFSLVPADDAPGPVSPPADLAPFAVEAEKPRVMLEVDTRWPVLASPIGAAHDGRGWIGVNTEETVVYDGKRRVRRFPMMVFGSDQLAPIPGGRWVVGARVLDAEGRVRFDGYSWCNRLGRLAGCRASSFSRDGTTAIIAAANSPSTCIADRGCPNANRSNGELVRMTFGDDPSKPEVRVLVEHEQRRDFVVAASERWVAAVEGLELSVWPAAGDGEPVTASLDRSVSQLAWLGDDLVIARWADPEYSELWVLDGADGYATAARWGVEGALQSFAVHPGGEWIAIGTAWYRARATVEIDIKRVEIYSRDGVRHVQIELDALPTSMAWSPQGDALFVSASGHDVDARVVRYSVEG